MISDLPPEADNRHGPMSVVVTLALLAVTLTPSGDADQVAVPNDRGRTTMADRENSPAYAALPRSARRVFAAIERAIGDGSTASVSYIDFRLDYGIARKSVSPSLKLLDHLGLVDIEPGPRCSNIFRLSRRWCKIDGLEAVRRAALAREVQPHRRFEKRRQPEPVKSPRPIAPTTAMWAPKRPRIMRRRMPSLPTMPWHDGR
jgi:hypothetical protein